MGFDGIFDRDENLPLMGCVIFIICASRGSQVARGAAADTRGLIFTVFVVFVPLSTITDNSWLGCCRFFVGVLLS